jgi:hypothetical protein
MVAGIADTWDEFTRHIEEALLEDDQNLVSKRRCIAAANAWDDRVDQLSRVIQSYMEGTQ